MMVKGWVSNKDLKSPNRLFLRYLRFLNRSGGGDGETSTLVSSMESRPVMIQIQVFLPVRSSTSFTLPGGSGFLPGRSQNPAE